MNSKTAHKIKHRKHANDEFMTPPDLALKLIHLVPYRNGDSILDPAPGDGAFTIDESCEDFFKVDKAYDWGITNPPYSNLDAWLEHSTYIFDKGFAYLLGLHNITPKRIKMCEDAGFGLTKIHLCKVFKWFGISAFCIWENGKSSIIQYDRKVWR